MLNKALKKWPEQMSALCLYSHCIVLLNPLYVRVASAQIPKDSFRKYLNTQCVQNVWIQDKIMIEVGSNTAM